MQISERGLALLREFEGFSAQAYVCPAGKMTIGYGHVVRPGEVFATQRITRKQAESILKQDVAVAERVVSGLVEQGLSQGQFDALVCLVYNIGGYAFGKSTLLRFIRQGDFAAAAGQFGRWIYAGGKALKGLERRREAEKRLFLS